jgi:hypothetical protein
MQPRSPGIAAPLGDVVTERPLLARIAPGDASLLAPMFAQPAVWEFPIGRPRLAPSGLASAKR